MIRQENYFVDPIRNILNHQIEIPDEYRLSCSIGIASLSGTVRPDHDLELLISRADESLYQAKRNGKGRIVVYRYPDS
jgi:GGDEF domain-containing protein